MSNEILGQNLKEFFHKEFGAVRTVVLNGQVWFVGKDIVDGLGYKNTRDAISRHCKGVVKYDILTKGGKQSMTIINERDVVRLITRSKLEKAQEFESWVFDEVIPSVMNFGGYVNDGKQEEFGNEIDFIKNHFTSFSPEVQEAMVMDLMKKQEEHKKQLEKANQTIDILVNEYTTFEDFKRVTNACAKALASKQGTQVGEVWTTYYKFLYNSEGINVTVRQDNAHVKLQSEREQQGKKPYSQSTLNTKVSKLHTIKQEEYSKCLKVMEAFALKYGVDINQIVRLELKLKTN